MTPQNALEHALVAAATDPSARPLFYRLALESPLLFVDAGSEVDAGSGADADSDLPVDGKPTVLRAGASVRAEAVEIDGVLHTAIFSSQAALSAVLQTERKFISMLGRNLFELMRGSHLILNPGLPYGKQFLPDEIEAMLDGTAVRGYSTQVLQEETRVLLGQPSDYPRHLTDALAALFRSRKEVEAAYLGLCAWPDADERPHVVIGIDMQGAREALMPAVMSTIRGVARQGEIVDVVGMDSSSFGAYLRTTKPFYKRKRFGLF